VPALSCLWAVLLLGFACGEPAPVFDAPPNIVLILCDDAGYGDPSCYGNTAIRTPHIDRLAAEGQRWTDFYAAGCVCIPSRMGLMTGRYPQRIYGERRTPARLPAGEITIAELLQQRGYRTALLGKWHLGMDDGVHPNDQGFDYFYGTPSSNDHFARKGLGSGHAARQNTTWEDFNVPLYRDRDIIEQPVRQPLFIQRYTKEAERWIREQRDQPFFLYLAHNMPHRPIAASEAFRGTSRAGRYGDVIEEIDWSVGRILQTLRDTGRDRNTLVVLTSDNGPWLLFPGESGSSGPLRNGKGTCWEGGFRVPAVFWWPGRIHPAVIDDFGTALDLFATFAAVADLAVPADRPMDSYDLSPTLFDRRPARRHTWFYFHRDGMFGAARIGEFKLHVSSVSAHRALLVPHDPPLLYNLARDVGERHNVTPLYPDTVAVIQRAIDAFMRELPPMPAE
jgi:arylsulfatase A-like enzyme